MVSIEKKQLAGPPKKVGELKGRPVYQVKTKGGFHLVVTPRGSGTETLGTGSHPAVAQHIARRREPDISWLELSKAEHVPLEAFEHLVPEWTEFTDHVRALES